MNEELDIIVTGFDVTDRQAEAGLIRVFGLDTQRAHRFVRELPTVAKRCPNPTSAERYAHALRSIGARVELRGVASLKPSDAAALRPTHSSLPIPAPSVMAQLHESMRVERMTARAIRLFRASEGLGHERASSKLDDVDTLSPRIPKAPPVPRDLHKMPNAALPRYSDRPAFEDESADRAGAAAGAPSPRAHADARPPPPLVGDAGSAEAVAESIRPHGIGLTHTTTASKRPGLSDLAAWHQLRRAQQTRRSRRRLWAGAALLLLPAYAGLHFSGVLESDDDRRRKVWADSGIEAGDHAEAAAWLQDPSHRLVGLDSSAARQLVERLERAGARGVYAVRIRSTPQGYSAGALIVDLPAAAAVRRVILWHCAKARGLEHSLVPDRGERYHLLTWQ